MVKLVYTRDLKSLAARRVGSIPTRTTKNIVALWRRYFYLFGRVRIERAGARREVFSEEKTSWRESTDFRWKSVAAQGKEPSRLMSARRRVIPTRTTLIVRLQLSLEPYFFISDEGVERGEIWEMEVPPGPRIY